MQPYSYYPYQNTYQNAYQQMMPQIQQNQAIQIQNNSGFIRVPNESTAREYPVAPGNSITFIDESAPFCYTKTAGNSPLEAAVFKRYRLVEENQAQNKQADNVRESSIDMSIYATKSDISALSADSESVRSEISTLKNELERLKSAFGKFKSHTVNALSNDDYEGIDDV